MAELFDRFHKWLGGVVTTDIAGEQTKIATRGYNSILKKVGPTGAVVAKRRGLKLVNATPVTGANPTINMQAMYIRNVGGTTTRYHVVLTYGGELGTLDSDPTSGTGAFTSISSIGATTTVPNHVIAKDLFFFTYSSGHKKLRGTTLEGWGITRPASAPATATGAAGAMTGTFEVRVTFFNANTGHESSASDTSNATTLASQQLSVTSIPVSADGQVTARRIYIRNTSNQTEFRLAATISDNVTTSTTLNVNTSLLITLGPDTAENDPPPSAARYAAWINSRMFVADGSNLYWSEKDKPEAFDPDNYEPIGAGDGQNITGIIGYGDVVFIFKQRSVYAVTGTNPENWRIRPIFTDVGAVSHRSLIVAGGALWWWSEFGPTKFDGSGEPLRIGEYLLKDDVAYEATIVAGMSVAEDPNNKLVIWAISEPGQTLRYDKFIALNYNTNSFVTNKWDPMPAASLATIEDNSGNKWVYWGNWVGEIFRFDDADNDGVPSGTDEGTFVAGGTSVSSITGTGFRTTGAGLAERMVTVVDSNDALMGRVRISSNTSTVLTLAESVTGLTSGATYTFYIGGPNFEWDTIDEDSDRPFEQKQYKRAYILAENNPYVHYVGLFTDENPDVVKRQSSFTPSGTKEFVPKNLVLSAVGRTGRLRVWNRKPDEPVAFIDLGLKSELLTDKIG